MSDAVRFPDASGPCLPLYMWYLIIEAVAELKDKKTLNALARVNRFLRGLAQPQLFRDVHFRYPFSETISFIDVLCRPHIVKHIKCIDMSAWGNAIDADIGWWTQTHSGIVRGHEEGIQSQYQTKATEVKEAIQKLFAMCRDFITTLRFGCGHMWLTRKTYDRHENFKWHAVDGKYLMAVILRPLGQRLHFEKEPSYVLFKSIAGEILIRNRFPRLEELSICSKSLRGLADMIMNENENWHPFWSVGWDNTRNLHYYADPGETYVTDPLPDKDQIGYLAENMENLQRVSIMDTKTKNALNNRYWKPRNPCCSAQHGDIHAEESGVMAAIRLLSVYAHKLRSLDLQIHHWCELRAFSENLKELSSFKLGCIALKSSLSNVIASLPSLKEIELDHISIPADVDNWANVFNCITSTKFMSLCRLNGLGYKGGSSNDVAGLLASPCCGYSKSTINERLADEISPGFLSAIVFSRGEYNPYSTYITEGVYQNPPGKGRVALCTSRPDDKDAFIALCDKLVKDSSIAVDDIPFWILCYHDSTAVKILYAHSGEQLMFI